MAKLNPVGAEPSHASAALNPINSSDHSLCTKQFVHCCISLFVHLLTYLFVFQEIDGQALLLLNLPTVQECMDLKLGPAIKLCHHIERVKLAFYQQFAS